MKPITIVIDDYPGWETSISPYRLTLNGITYSPMSADEVRVHIQMILGHSLPRER